MSDNLDTGNLEVNIEEIIQEIRREIQEKGYKERLAALEKESQETIDTDTGGTDEPDACVLTGAYAGGSEECSGSSERESSARYHAAAPADESDCGCH